VTDKVSGEIRRKTMQAIKSKNTLLEEKVIKELWKRGIRFRRNVSDLEGKPDIAIKKYKQAVFIDSCFWHGCTLHCRMPESNIEYWMHKIERNRKRDEQINDAYKNRNWRILRVWEHDIKDSFDETIATVINFLGCPIKKREKRSLNERSNPNDR